MRMTQAGLELLKSFESCKLTAYKDTGGIWTIGWGSTLGVHDGMTITQDEADSRLEDEIGDVEAVLGGLVKYPLSSCQWDALVCLAFNIGTGSVHASELLQSLNEGNMRSAANQFMRWIFVQSEPSDGLYARRKAERAWFLKTS